MCLFSINNCCTSIIRLLFNPYKPGVLLWDIGKPNSPRCKAAKRGVPMLRMGNPNDKDGKIQSSQVS